MSHAADSHGKGQGAGEAVAAAAPALSETLILKSVVRTQRHSPGSLMPPASRGHEHRAASSGAPGSRHRNES